MGLCAYCYYGLNAITAAVAAAFVQFLHLHIAPTLQTKCVWRVVFRMIVALFSISPYGFLLLPLFGHRDSFAVN